MVGPSRRRQPTRSPSFSYQLYHLLWVGLDLVLPPSCGGCGKRGWRWCPECRATVAHPHGPLCEVCGTSLNGSGSLCPDCRSQPPRYRALRSWAIFAGPVRRALHQLKYRRDIGLGEALTPQLYEYATTLDWPVDLVVSIPLGGRRLRDRGYNQVALIARPLSMALRLEYASRAVVRTRETQSQVGLTKAARHDNVHDAFEAERRDVSGRIILLVDDVATTGATLSSCSEALYAAGAADVFALTVARANHVHHFGEA